MAPVEEITALLQLPCPIVLCDIFLRGLPGYLRINGAIS
jgi:hypothetical protein